jgi:predicted metal-dependent phosphoesterase TrpH
VAVASAPDFDLQSHSVHSDGALPPAEVVSRAGAAGVRLLALSDHDTVAGVEEALRAGRACGVSVVSAVEVSAVHDDHEDLHVLGYRVRHRDPELLSALEGYRADRARRSDAMAQALEELGFSVDRAALEARVASGRSVGRPHLAQAVVGRAENAERLEREGLTGFSRFLEAYLLPGKPGYRGRSVPTVEEAIDTIHRAGGVAVWAHPFWDLAEPPEVLATARRFAEWGLDGIEAFYVTHDREQTLVLSDFCREAGLLSTGSSDFHGPDHKLFARFRAFELYGSQAELGPVASPTV